MWRMGITIYLCIGMSLTLFTLVLIPPSVRDRIQRMSVSQFWVIIAVMVVVWPIVLTAATIKTFRRL